MTFDKKNTINNIVNIPTWYAILKYKGGLIMYSKDNYLVKDAFIVNDLLNAGYVIMSVAPNRYNPVASVFYFRPDEGLEEAVRQAYLSHEKAMIYFD